MFKKRNFFTIFLLLSIALFSFAQEIKYPTLPGAPSPSPRATFSEYVIYLINLFFAIAGITALGVLIWGAVQWLTSLGSPQAIAAAKNKISGAFLGLILLIFSYIILTTINPKLAFFRVKEIQPTEGVYLIRGEESVFISESKGKLEFNNPTEIEFVSPPNELLEVYLFEKENFQGTKEIIKNPGPGIATSVSLSPVNSIYFIKEKGGFYLYDEPNFQLTKFSHPLFVNFTRRDLEEWGEKTDSIRVLDASTTVHKGAVFFSGNFEGKCGIFYTTSSACAFHELPDLSTTTVIGCGVYDNEFGMSTDTLNSLLVFSIDITKSYSGKVTFYEKINCQGNQLSFTPSSGVMKGKFKDYLYASTPYGTTSWEGKVESFKIEGDLKVVLIASSTEGWICQGAWKKNIQGCVSKLEGTKVYPAESEIRPTAFYLITTD